jgi:hypothetical protein
MLNIIERTQRKREELMAEAMTVETILEADLQQRGF